MSAPRGPDAGAAEAAATATNIHYEQPPAAFEAFLGAHMKYTCALFTGGESLDEAQEAYLALIARQLGLRGGEHVLDVGCGWGSLTLFLASQAGCRVTGVTPSAVQAEYIRRRAAGAGVAGLVQVEVGPFQTVPLAERSFDAVAMIEVIEHLPEHREPLAKAYRLLRPSARLFLSATCYRSRAHQQEYENRPASADAVELYGFTAMTPLSQLLAELEDAGFSLGWLTDTTSHYGPTIEHWQRGIEFSKERMDAVTPGFADRLSRYFDAARSSWGYTAKHYAVTGIRSRHGATLLPC
jgi:cyclopropane-fatty-acyl-phospholipid synthase